VRRPANAHGRREKELVLTSTIDRRRIPRALAPRLMLALAVLAGVLVTVVGHPDPASAWTIQHDPDEIVLTSVRLHDETVRATLVLTLQRDGDVVLLAQDVHNSGATRKFYKAEATVHVPAADFSVTAFLPDSDALIRIGGDTTQSKETRTYSQALFDKWDVISTHAVEASLNLSVQRVGIQ
jgi:hypothetical protein